MTDIFSTCLDQSTLTSAEPSFIQYKGWLSKPPVEPNEHLLEHLAHRISRTPTDLQSHVQRVMLCMQLQSHEKVYGAILDLFIALGDKGYALRARLLAQSRNILSTQQHSVLEAALHSGISELDVVPLTKYSRLSAGISGSLEIVSLVHENQSSASTNVLGEVRDLLDSNHIETACDLLESELLSSPKNLEISQELLTIYHHTRDLTRITKTLNRLKSTPFAAQEKWQEMANRLAMENEHD